MKKNISINLYGTLYAIDEDAYTLLEQYIDNMKAYFSKQEGGDETADDIERRIAELLWQNKEEGHEAVDIETVKRIIGRIGEFEGEESAQTASDKGNGQESGNDDEGEKMRTIFEAEPTKKKLYRDTDNKMLAGVIGGIAKYFGATDPLPWRIAFVVLCLLLRVSWFSWPSAWHIHLMSPTWILPLAYLVMWCIVPECKTTEDRLRMKGKEVNPDSIRHEVLQEQQERENRQSQPANSNQGCANGCLSVFVLLLKIFAFIILAFVSFIVLTGLFSGLVAVATVGGSLFSLSQASGWLIAGITLCLLCITGIPIYALCRTIFAKTTQRGSVSLALLIVWLLSIGSLVPMCTKLVHNAAESEEVSSFLKSFHDWSNWDLHVDTEMLTDSTSNMTEQYNDAETFNKIVLRGVGTLHIENGEKCTYRIVATPATLEHTTVSVTNGELEIRPKSMPSNQESAITMYVTVPDLKQIENHGVGHIQCDDTIRIASNFVAETHGVGSIKIPYIEAPSVKLEQHGVGQINVGVKTDLLEVRTHGVGTVSVWGNTQKYHKNKHGISKIDDSDLNVTGD